LIIRSMCLGTLKFLAFGDSLAESDVAWRLRAGFFAVALSMMSTIVACPRTRKMLRGRLRCS